ncbi:DUF4227 family protein [Paenibacillus sp. OAS669]|uniref:DUF4227 family protein n=1 Tax=Paenibacillus sp. OAS669 TaxID=2663821 RepID=UPI001789924F|nr:DUF4227 family protein [Paenibacillus sp. OAS669]MBE1446046.1 hypothetical protein [Paenibacillus sp. OAS669]
MIFSLRKWVGRLKFLLVFALFSYAMYHMLLAITQWIEPTQRYKEPTGRAVKVFQNHVMMTEQGPMSERLKLFYWIGE